MIFKSEGLLGKEFKDFRNLKIVKKVEKYLIQLFYSLLFESLLEGKNEDTYIDLLLNEASKLIKKHGLDPADLPDAKERFSKKIFGINVWGEVKVCKMFSKCNQNVYMKKVIIG